MTLAQLESKINITKGSLSKIENGETKKPEFKTVQAIASVLNIPFHEYVEIYIEIQQKSDSLRGILEIAITTPENTSIAPKIATKFLENEKEDSLELVKQLYSTTASITDTTIQLDLYNSIIDYSRAHGIMPYIAQGMYQVYMIERNDFSRLNSTYHTGKNILNYANYLNSNERVVLHYCLAVHAYSLMLYEDSIQFSEYVIEHTNKNEYKAATINNIIFCFYNLKRFEQSNHYLEEYKKFNFPYIADNSRMFQGILNMKTGNGELALIQLSSYLECASEYNLVYVVSELMNIYLQKCDFDTALTLLNYESKMEESLEDARTTPDKWARLASFYQLVGNVLLRLDTNRSFDYYLKSAKEYLKIGITNHALESLALINTAIIEDSSRFSIEIARRTNEMYFQIINKKY
ncbi:helix-turn-helix transcriptional regulator [Paenibacillus sp. 481]|nr:helix-turn-helix transcriptional regulator [Paenibacillus sp. 481]